MSASIPTFTLNNGRKIPAVGLGCWMGEPGCEDRAYAMCIKAIKIGYRHIDTAAGYGNEEAVGRAIRDSGAPRSEFFVTTKLNNTDHGNVREAFEKSLAALNTGYIDLYLVHWPQALTASGVLRPSESPTIAEVWTEMEKLLETGKVRSIGVSNYSIKTLDRLLPDVKVVPAVNQVQLHPYLPQHELKKYCEDKGMHLTAYSSLGQGSTEPNIVADATVASIAKTANVTTGQILLSWGVQRGTSVIPKSESEERLRSNFTLVKLSDEDMKTLDELHKKPGLHRSLLAYHQNGGVFGWSHEELGWDFDANGIVPQKVKDL